MRNLFVLLLLILGCQVYAFDIVYPKKANVTINAKSTFFIGSSNEPFTINGQNVPLHSSGGFAYVVDLKDGENKFVLESQTDKKHYIITKPVIKQTSFSAQTFRKYDSIKHYYVISDNTPLRSTPKDAGINRISHLQRNIILNIDGELGGFYRVVLSKDKYAWISKTSVKQCDNYTNKLARINGFDFKETSNYYEFIYHLDKTVPYEIVEGNPMILKFYGVSDGQSINNEGESVNNPISSHIQNGVYIKEFPISYNLAGYSGKYYGNDFVWRIRKPFNVNFKKPFKHLTIVIDAGHGGSEYGAIGCLGDKEKDINLKIAKHLQDILKMRGADVVMTRDDDTYVGLQQRVDISNYNDAQFFISIHGNALPDGADPNKKSGVGVYYYYDQSKELAQTLLDTMTSMLNLNNDNIHQASFAVVRNTNALSVLVETAYLINPEDNSKLVDESFQKRCALAIAEGLQTYILLTKSER